MDSLSKLYRELTKVILGKEEQIKLILACWLSKGHVLLEDLPGTGKTKLAKSLAKLCNMHTSRVQFTPDLLPNDLLGVSILDNESNKFKFIKGPLFTEIFLGDEINRATPRTQSALLEAMGEGQITVENKTGKLPEHFFVMATQNPIEQQGTFPLPEAQLDRFMIKLSLGHLDKKHEIELNKLLSGDDPFDEIKPIFDKDEIETYQRAVSDIKIHDAVHEYISEIVNKTRTHPAILHGSSFRGTRALTKMSQALSLFENKNYVIPSIVSEIVMPVLAHRIILKPESKYEGNTEEKVLKDILDKTKTPTI